MHEATDADLVELARADNTEAFRLLLERYHPLAFAITLHFVTQPETAQDLVQEAMLQAYLSLDHLREATRFWNAGNCAEIICWTPVDSIGRTTRVEQMRWDRDLA